MGWFDYVGASKDPRITNNQGGIQFEPTVVVTSKQVPVTTTKIRHITKTDANGNRYTVAVPYSEAKTQTIHSQSTIIRAKMIMPDKSSIDLQKYLSSTPD